MNTGAATPWPARAPAKPATSDSPTIPNHSTGKTRFRKNVWRDEMRLWVCAANTLILTPLRGSDDGTAAGRSALSLLRPGLIELVAHEPAHGNITHRNEQHPEQRRTQHPADYAGADGVARVATRTARDHHGEHPQDEGE